MKKQNRTHALVVCNGEVPKKKFLSSFLNTTPYILCADGGANKARQAGIKPDCIIGDLDSITMQTKKYFSSVPIIHIADQYNTDLEKALNYLLEKKYTTAIVAGAMGERTDHTLANFSILLKYHTRIDLKFIDERCTVEVIKKKIHFNAELGQHISLAPMGKCSGITTRGLKYPLHNESLAPGIREGLSNMASATKVSITVQKGNLLLFKIRNEV